ncbi:hypothetical protein [Klebsiella oxytoca]|uniref:Uncharacterized protein n=1 Tax=Klebsiella oxytoca TaxID=571 RepID=A0A6B8MTZ5_KLEOX|nr:hypothetical protein [Klebsiella oxytoca]QGN38409.1 hypothetical protein GJ746_14335 [Klebsiella oxytoca]
MAEMLLQLQPEFTRVLDLQQRGNEGRAYRPGRPGQDVDERGSDAVLA